MGNSIKRLAVLGSTGSIGRQTLDIARAFPDRLRIAGLAAGTNTSLLTQQINEFKPKLVSIESKKDRPAPVFFIAAYFGYNLRTSIVSGIVVLGGIEVKTAVAHYLTVYHIHNILGDVGSMVGNSLQLA